MIGLARSNRGRPSPAGAWQHSVCLKWQTAMVCCLGEFPAGSGVRPLTGPHASQVQAFVGGTVATPRAPRICYALGGTCSAGLRTGFASSIPSSAGSWPHPMRTTAWQTERCSEGLFACRLGRPALDCAGRATISPAKWGLSPIPRHDRCKIAFAIFFFITEVDNGF